MLITLTCSEQMKTSSSHKRPGPLWKTDTFVGLCLAVAFVVLVTGLFEARVALTQTAGTRQPLPVASTTFTHQDSYFRPVSYLGLVTAGRKATLGFELSGQIATFALREGDPVSMGQQLAALDTSALQARRRATAAELEQARTELELAQLKARRQQDLIATGAVSKEAFDDTRLRARALNSQVEAVAARLASIDIELEKSRLVAPYDGVISERFVYQGAVVSAGAPVLQLVELSNQEAQVGVPAALASTLEVGALYNLKLRDRSIEAALLSIRPDVDPMTRTTLAVFAMPAEVNALDGEPLTLQYREPVTMGGGWLPMSALLEGQRGVWNVLRIETVGAQSQTIRESVEVLDIQGDRVFVRGTLATGDRVVANGTHRITPGTPVVLAEGS